MSKRYYWIKLQKDFFQQREIKKLRKIAGGDTYTIIYLKILLLTADKEGYIEYEEYNDFIEELSLDIDEDEDNVKICVSFLLANGLMVDLGEKKFVPAAVEMTGSEDFSASRVRRHRQKKKVEALQCNTDVTIGGYNVTIEKEIELELDIDKEIVADATIKKVENGDGIISLFENNIHPISGRIEYEDLSDLLQTCGKDHVRYAIEEAVKANARNMKYIRKVAEADRDGKSKRYAPDRPKSDADYQRGFYEAIMNCKGDDDANNG